MSGRLNGTSSSASGELSPRNKVFESTNDTANTDATANANTAKNAADLYTAELDMNTEITMNMPPILPLHGMSEFVNIAMRRSRSDSIMRQPHMPTALHPKPIAEVSACFPQVPHDLYARSRLKAMRGKIPKSSHSVNIGKKIAIGGSITQSTHVDTRYIPSVRADTNTGGRDKSRRMRRSGSSSPPKSDDKSSLG